MMNLREKNEGLQMLVGHGRAFIYNNLHVFAIVCMFFSAKDWESWVPAYLEQHFDLVEKQRGGMIKPCRHIISDKYAWDTLKPTYNSYHLLPSLAWKVVQQTFRVGPCPLILSV